MTFIIPRSPWTPEFPDIIIHSDLRTRNSHPSYAAAKAGDPQAAKNIVEDLLSQSAIAQLKILIAGRSPILLAVTAEEVSGFNAIPDGMAQSLAASLGLTAAAGAVVQVNKVAHTRANDWHRLVTPAVFAGSIVTGADYLLVDDHVGFGGTLANLRVCRTARRARHRYDDTDRNARCPPHRDSQRDVGCATIETWRRIRTILESSVRTRH
jgi:hypothetical protein